MSVTRVTCDMRQLEIQLDLPARDSQTFRMLVCAPRRIPRLFLGARRRYAVETALPNGSSAQFRAEERGRTKTAHIPPEPESEEEQQSRFEAFLKQKAREKPTRPQRRVAVDPNHGLWGFFRKVEKDGEDVYETLEKDLPGRTIGSGALKFDEVTY